VCGTTEQLAEKRLDFGEIGEKHTSGPKGRADSAAFMPGDKSPAYLKTEFSRKH
jgi:hypothetical protein